MYMSLLTSATTSTSTAALLYRRDCERVGNGTHEAPALPGHAPLGRPLPSHYACALLCDAESLCRGFSFAPLAEATDGHRAGAATAGGGYCTLAGPDDGHTTPRHGHMVRVTTRCVERVRSGEDAEEARAAEQAAARRQAKLRNVCGPGLGEGGIVPANLTVLVAGAPRTGSTWQHRALYEIAILSRAYDVPPLGLHCGSECHGCCHPAFGYVDGQEHDGAPPLSQPGSAAGPSLRRQRRLLAAPRRIMPGVDMAHSRPPHGWPRRGRPSPTSSLPLRYLFA